MSATTLNIGPICRKNQPGRRKIPAMLAETLSLSALRRAAVENARPLGNPCPVMIGEPPTLVLLLEHRESEASGDVEPALHRDTVEHPAGRIVRRGRIEIIAAMAGHDLDRQV